MKLLSKLFTRHHAKPLDWSNPKLARFASELQQLDALPLGSRDEIAVWDAAADLFRRKLYSEYEELYDSLPHEIEHYLTDSDIRARDPGYAAYQRDLLAEILTYRNEN